MKMTNRTRIAGAVMHPAFQEAWQIVCQWVWNVRLELGHQFEPTPLCTTEFAPPIASISPHPAPPSGYAPPQVGLPWKADRFSGQDFPLQPDGTLRCPAGQELRAHEQRREVDGSLRVVYAGSHRSCRPWPDATSSVNGRGAPPRSRVREVGCCIHWSLGLNPFVFRDWNRRHHRRACIQLVRHQCVKVEVEPPTTARLTVTPAPLSRAERCPLSALVGRTAGPQCASPHGWTGDDQAVRCPSSLCQLAGSDCRVEGTRSSNV